MKFYKYSTRYIVNITFIFFISIASNANALNACKDENGRSYFTDLACPEGTTKQKEVDLQQTNTYRTRESINIDLVNDHERRYNTGRSWRWVKKNKSGDKK